MDANTYQAEAKRTLIDKPDREISGDELQVVWGVLQIAIVVGKLMEHLKKGIFHQHGLDYNFVYANLEAIADMVKTDSVDAIPAVPSLSGPEIMKLWVLCGLIGESAEIAQDIQMELESGGDRSVHLQREAGDCLWYLVAIATQHGLSLNDILIANVEKLQKRYANGYSSQASINRME